MKVDILVLSLHAPLLVGVYHNGELVEKIETMDKSSDALPRIFTQLLKRFTCKGLYFARGPGSFMAIKVTYLFLKTLEVALEIPLKACDGFVFNGNSPIKAVGKLFFIKEDGKIATRILECGQEGHFALPEVLPLGHFTATTEPLYHLPAL